MEPSKTLKGSSGCPLCTHIIVNLNVTVAISGLMGEGLLFGLNSVTHGVLLRVVACVCSFLMRDGVEEAVLGVFLISSLTTTMISSSLFFRL